MTGWAAGDNALREFRRPLGPRLSSAPPAAKDFAKWNQ